MSLLSGVRLEFKKIKRSMILPLLAVPSILVIITGMASIGKYLSSQPKNAWEMMFVQSSLMFAYYLMPLSLIIICVMMLQTEYAHRSIIKVLTLPIRQEKIALAKLITIVLLTAVELILYFLLFIAAGSITTMVSGVSVVTPIPYLLKWCVLLFVSALPMVTIFWAITVLTHRPIAAIAIEFVFVLPGILVSNLPIWWAYPFNYPGYLISSELSHLSGSSQTANLPQFWIAAVVLTTVSAALSIQRFAKGEIE
ncbi:hypothetical protein EQM14_11460 [Caproiciproducens sp. NJN-50]|uniref:ABC transporter permease n=1 Tax=Acutalibacteraceae TaxID=3082771 RepID=UPI000FFE16C4|nr:MULTISPECIES: ABC transporter permease [Acutalibacteraceae]QAT50327.1 hypothetical protein EQM14_11460 [Caproiciproducens sp. NJN-50]